ncbi:MAG: twin-arginine translocase TatA/TatE family subunit [Verrucomicrobia bacterium]|nr:twin-arginine translocase TatA/TatE family subunit [Verrucomicrobiota bacterium]
MNLPLALLDGPVFWAILAVALLLFGGSKIPELARGLGKAKREFKKASEEVEHEVRSAVEEDERRQARLKNIEQEERDRIRAQIEAEEKAKRAQDGKQN